VVEVPYEAGSTIRLGQPSGTALDYLVWSRQTDEYQSDTTRRAGGSALALH